MRIHSGCLEKRISGSSGPEVGHETREQDVGLQGMVDKKSHTGLCGLGGMDGGFTGL